MRRIVVRGARKITSVFLIQHSMQFSLPARIELLFTISHASRPSLIVCRIGDCETPNMDTSEWRWWRCGAIALMAFSCIKEYNVRPNTLNRLHHKKSVLSLSMMFINVRRSLYAYKCPCNDTNVDDRQRELSALCKIVCECATQSNLFGMATMATIARRLEGWCICTEPVKFIG